MLFIEIRIGYAVDTDRIRIGYVSDTDLFKFVTFPLLFQIFLAIAFLPLGVIYIVGVRLNLHVWYHAMVYKRKE